MCYLLTLLLTGCSHCTFYVDMSLLSVPLGLKKRAKAEWRANTRLMYVVGLLCCRWRRRSTLCVRFCQPKKDMPQSSRGNLASARSMNSGRISPRAGKKYRPPMRKLANNVATTQPSSNLLYSMLRFKQLAILTKHLTNTHSSYKCH